MRLERDYLFAEDDLVVFADDETPYYTEEKGECWKILIVDDEKDIHNVTKMVLKDVQFDGRGLTFFSAYSGAEGRNKIAEISDVAVILLDVVMEADDSGLSLVKYIREDLGNHFVRIILRTGYPGEAPEREVILNYDINDYKEKTELTSQKLFTSVVSALRAYKDVMRVDQNKKGLEKIIRSSSSIFGLKHMHKFSREILETFKQLIGQNEMETFDGFIANRTEDGYQIVAGKGRFEELENQYIENVLDGETMKLVVATLQSEKHRVLEDRYISFFRSKEEDESLVYLEYETRLDEMGKSIVEVFDRNVTVAFDNVYLNKEIENTQAELLFMLGEVVEARSEETGNHVRRVSEYAKLLATKYGLNEEESDELKMASPMHDLGKIGIPDHILHKPGKLTEEEFEIIKRHPTIGYELLKKSKRSLFKISSILALEHHEHYDGHGYPRGISGEQIHLYGRIMAICDVFDALTSDRIYRKAWEVDRVVDYMMERRGTQFDPILLDLFVENLDEVKVIMNHLKD